MTTTVTLQTIADACGVSRTTASNAFSRPDQLSAELRARILDAAERLGYAGPHPGGRSLRKGRVGAIGVVLRESLAYALRDPHAVAFLGGLAERAERPAVSLTLIPTPRGPERASPVTDALVDGFLMYSLPDGHPAVAAVLARRLPAVFVDGPRPEGSAFVGIDDRAAMREITELVLDAGHTRVAVLSFRLLPDGRVGRVDRDRLARAEYAVTRCRLQGALAAAADRAVDIDVHECGVNTRAAAASAATGILAAKPRPTAIVCLSDQIALGVLDAAAELGLFAPRDLSVTGFDDILDAAVADLTTVRQSAHDKGRTAFDLLASGEERAIVLPHRLLRRGSIGPPSA